VDDMPSLVSVSAPLVGPADVDELEDVVVLVGSDVEPELLPVPASVAESSSATGGTLRQLATPTTPTAAVKRVSIESTCSWYPAPQKEKPGRLTWATR
jgi:hypothetical protein